MRQIEQDLPLYRQGTFGQQRTGNAPFWSLKNPASTPGFAAETGMNGQGTPDWMMKATLRPGALAITRDSPALGANPGGGIEAVTETNAVKIEWFHMP